MKRNMETRHVATMASRSEEGAAPTLYGYIAKWDEPSVLIYEEGKQFVEYLRKGCFARSLAENAIFALYSHKYSDVIGTTENGSLTLREDDIGLYFELAPAATTVGKDVAVLVGGGFVKGCSFGAFWREDKWHPQSDGTYIHEVFDVDLLEVTITPIPAFPSTEVSVRSLKEAMAKIEEVEVELKTSRLERAKKIAAIL